MATRDWRKGHGDPSVPNGDLWSGGGKAYRIWMASKLPHSPSGAPRSVRQGQSEGLGFDLGPMPGRGPRLFRIFRSVSAASEWPPNPRAAHFHREQGRSRKARFLALATAGAVAVLFAVPLAWSARGSMCAAAEVALIAKVAGPGSRYAAAKMRVVNWTGPDGHLVSRGRAGQRIAALEYAGWPPIIGCTALFWRVRAEGVSFAGFNAVLLQR